VAVASLAAEAEPFGSATSAAAADNDDNTATTTTTAVAQGDGFFKPTTLSPIMVVDCSKGAIAVSLGQKVVLSFNGYWGKRSE
jgi:hypothetical protein